MLVALDEFKSSRYYDSNAGWADEEVTEALVYAEDRFYRLTGRHRWGYWLQPRTLTLNLDGTGKRLLYSPYPLLVLDSCQVAYSGGTQDVTSEVRWRNHFLFLTAGWWEGFANVTVTGAFGDPAYISVTDEGARANVPEDVREAVRRLANRKLRHLRIAGEQLSERRPPTPSEPVPPPTLTGDREVDGIIRSYTVRRPLHALDVRGPLSAREARDEA